MVTCKTCAIYFGGRQKAKATKHWTKMYIYIYILANNSCCMCVFLYVRLELCRLLMLDIIKVSMHSLGYVLQRERFPFFSVLEMKMKMWNLLILNLCLFFSLCVWIFFIFPFFFLLCTTFFFSPTNAKIGIQKTRN